MAALSLPTHCRAGVVSNHGPHFKLSVQNVPVPSPSMILLVMHASRNIADLDGLPYGLGPEEILIQIKATGLCYSDIHYMLEDLPLPRMGDYGVQSPGHEGAGIVVAVGCNVKGWKIGDRAGIAPTWDTCMSCDLCSTDMECHCRNAIPTGLKVSGTYQQYITSPARYASRIPDGVDDFSAGPIMCSGSTMYRALRESNLRAGQFAAIIGAGGGVGHMGVQVAKAMGLRVIGIDAGTEKETLCLQLGCEAFVDISKSDDPIKDVREIAEGKGAHGIFVTASAAAAYRMAPRMARIGGCVICVGMPASGTAFAGDDPMYLILNNLRVVGSLTGSREDTASALSMAARGLLVPIYERIDLQDLPEAIGKLRQGKMKGRYVVGF